MALQLNYDSPFGITFTEAYAKVLEFSGNESNVDFSVAIWKDKIAYDADSSFIERLSFAAPYGTSTEMDSLYAWLIANAPIFTNATIVLD